MSSFCSKYAEPTDLLILALGFRISIAKSFVLTKLIVQIKRSFDTISVWMGWDVDWDILKRIWNKSLKIEILATKYIRLYLWAAQNKSLKTFCCAGATLLWSSAHWHNMTKPQKGLIWGITCPAITWADAATTGSSQRQAHIHTICLLLPVPTLPLLSSLSTTGTYTAI